MTDYITRDSGKRMEFETGSRRDTNEGKTRPGLIGPELLRRVGDLLARGAEKYGDNNWRLGQKASRYYDSLCRHLLQWAEGDNTEDHLAAVVFNVMGIMHLEAKMPEHLDHERYDLTKRPEPVINVTIKGIENDPAPIVVELKSRGANIRETLPTPGGYVGGGVLTDEALDRVKQEVDQARLSSTAKGAIGLRGYCIRCQRWHDVDADWCEGLRSEESKHTARYPED